MTDRKPLTELTDLQLGILNVLWENGEASAGEVHEALAEDLARKTIGTLLARLEQYGVVTHRTRGREFIYRAAVTRNEVREARVRNLARNLFAGDPVEMINFALAGDEVAEGDLERLRAMIEAYRRQ